MVLIFTGVRIWRLDNPPVMFFDEAFRSAVAEQIALGQPTPDQRHPPLAALLMALMLQRFQKVHQQQISLPFAPIDAAYLPFTDSIYFLSPDGTRLVIISCKDPTRQQVMGLRRHVQRLLTASHSTLYVLGSREQELVRLNEEGQPLQIIPLPFPPGKVVLTDPHGHHLLIGHFRTGRLALIDSHNGQVVWALSLKTRLSDFSFDPRYGLLYIALPTQKRLLAIDPDERKEVGHWHLGLTPSSVIPVAMPSLVPSGRHKGRNLLYVFDASRKRALCVNPAGVFPPKLIPFVTSLTAIAWQPKVPYIFAASNQTVYALNGATRQIAYAFPISFPVTKLLLSSDGRTLVGMSESHPQVVFWRLPNPLFLLRLPSAFLGGLLLPLLCFALAYQATRDLSLGLFAMLFVGVDPLLFLLSRMALLDIYVACSVVAAYLCCYRYLTAVTLRERLASVGLMGVLLGLGIASKWSAAPAFLGTLMLMGLASFRAFRDCPQVHADAGRLPLIVATTLFIAMLTYLATYTIYWVHGMSLWDIIKWQGQMFRFHAHTPHPHELASRWWQWVLGIKTGLLWHEDLGARARWIYLYGAPWLWLPGLVCMGFAAL